MIVLDTAKLVSIEAIILKAQLRWLGHVTRMDSCRQRFKDTIKESLKHCGFPACELEAHAQDRTGWQTTVKAAFSAFESSRREYAILNSGGLQSCCSDVVLL